ncbi:MAG: glutamine--tRNA ligase/YqeY domain fusion protein [Gammaproteobacteria bacterium]|nr:glutamine--tRNA ligase/YqeY domain fusion protein [Gammaproteobacteria bacterium]
MDSKPDHAPAHFIRHIIEADNASGKHGGRVVTRFPPEPNGYLHIGHAKSICLNFGIAEEYSGTCNLRFDDTNPDTEDEEYTNAIQADVRWLGFDWAERLFHASDYFDALYGYACELIRKGLAYVDSQSAEEIRATRGSLTEPGVASPWRDRSVADNLALFERMRAGDFPEGAHILRARIDMGSPNINLRDPALFRIRHAPHHRTGEKWKIYPMYDYAHCISDALEGITHSLCTLEFEDHRPLYDWVLDQLDVPCHPQQIEFARLELNYTITSKRKLLTLVRDGHVSGWDDPRLPTLKGMRRRGYPPAAIRAFCERVGVTKKQTVIDMAVLENCVREELDRSAPRALVVLDPLKVVIENFAADQVEWLEVQNHPKDPAFGTRRMPLTREIWIDRDDFMEDPPKKYHRLAPGAEVRLRFSYVIRCTEVIKDSDGRVVELRCQYDASTAGGQNPDGRKVKGIIHWASATHGATIEVRLIDRLFTVPDPAAQEDFLAHLNPDSEVIVREARAEPALQDSTADSFQFERVGYFCRDAVDSRADAPVFIRTVTLRDTWARINEGDGA